MLAYYSSGNPVNPMVVLLHGFCDSSVTWVDLANHLNNRYFVVAIDNLGHGLSPRFSSQQLQDPFQSCVTAVRDTLQYLIKLYGKTPVAIGHSMGGAIFSVLAGTTPQLFAGLVVEDPAWLSPIKRQEFIANADAGFEQSKIWRDDPNLTVAHIAHDRPAWNNDQRFAWALSKAQVDPRLVRTGVVTFTEPWQDVAQKIAVPTLVITSNTDSVLIGEEGIAAIHKLANHNLSTEIVPNVDHSVRLSDPQTYDRIVDHWLAQLLK